MRIAVISDLHLGGDSRTDSFQHDDHEFLRFLAYLEANFERIVLLGDIWETLTSPLPFRRGRFSHTAELLRAREHHTEIAAVLRRPAFAYVHGNHDQIAAEVDQAPSSIRWEANGMRLLFTHGHQSDSLVMRAQAIAEAGVCAGGWFKRGGLHAVYKLVDRIDRHRSGHDADVISPVERWAMRRALREDADIVVTGHTHFLRKHAWGNRLYMNCGTCSGGRIAFSAIDTSSGSFSNHESY